MRILKKKRKKRNKGKPVIETKKVSVQKHVRLFKETFFSQKKKEKTNGQRHVIIFFFFTNKKKEKKRPEVQKFPNTCFRKRS